MHTHISDSAVQILGHTKDEIIGKLFFHDFFLDKEREILKEYYFNLLEQGKSIGSMDLQLKNKYDEIKHVQVTAMPIQNKDGEAIGFKGVCLDVTDKKMSENLVSDKHKEYLLIKENASDVIWIYNSNQRKFTYISPSIKHLRGISKEEALNETLSEFTHPEDYERVRKLLRHHFMNDDVKPNDLKHEIRQKHNDGHYIWVEISLKYNHNELDEIEVIGVSKDISRIKEAERKANYLLEFDELTDLRNRRSFENDLIELDKESNLPLSIVMIDVNGLQFVNEVYGFQEGNNLIKRVARAIKTNVRGTDRAYRVCCNEFNIILTNTNINASKKIVERIKSKLNEETMQEVSVSVSVGIGVKEDKDQYLKSIFLRAEEIKNLEKKSKISKLKENSLMKIMHKFFTKVPEAKEHVDIITEISTYIAGKLKLDDSEILDIEKACFFHEIGIAILDPSLYYLSETDELDNNEYLRITEIGYQLLRKVPKYEGAAKLINQLHERYDGQGIPSGVSGEKISLGARIIKIVKQYTYLTQHMTKAEANDYLIRKSSTRFDPMLIDIIIQL